MKKLALIIFLSCITLMLIGIALVMSASSAISEANFDNAFHLFNSHLFKVVIGIVLMAGFAMFPYEYYKKISKPAIFLAALALVAVLFTGSNFKGAGRWINLGFFSFQPAEAAKFILILHIAALIERKGEQIRDFKKGFLYLYIWVIIIAGLILIQPNLSNAILIVLISLTILYVGGARLKHMLFTSVVSLFTAGAAAMAFNHSRERILTFVKSVTEGGGINFQVNQSILSLGSGGIFGVGLGNSRQSKFFLPEAYGDFIFAILGEELGFIGSILITILYSAIFFSGIIIAKRTKDVFGQMLAFGISLSIMTYFMINIGVTTGLLPTTGLPLPFISYGGTSLLFLCISVGILLNVALVQSKFESVHETVLPVSPELTEVYETKN